MNINDFKFAKFAKSATIDVYKIKQMSHLHKQITVVILLVWNCCQCKLMWHHELRPIMYMHNKKFTVKTILRA